jgi:hypothetical protein
MQLGDTITIIIRVIGALVDEPITVIVDPIDPLISARPGVCVGVVAVALELRQSVAVII